MRTKRSASGTLAPSAVAKGSIFLSRECASRPEGFLLYGNSNGISYKVKIKIAVCSNLYSYFSLFTY